MVCDLISDPNARIMLEHWNHKNPFPIPSEKRSSWLLICGQLLNTTSYNHTHPNDILQYENFIKSAYQ